MSEHQDKLEKLSPAERTVVLTQELVKDTPLPFKHLMTSADMQMVIGGLKGSTEFYQPKKTFESYRTDIDDLSNVLSKFGLRLLIVPEGLHFAGYTNEKTMPLQQLVIYNPGRIKIDTSNSKFAPPYDGHEALDDYLIRAKKEGYFQPGLEGKVLSFPESAIQFFLNKTEAGLVAGSGAETYVHPTNPEVDVLEREKVKNNFFYELQHNEQMARLSNSQDIRDSRAEFIRRIKEGFGQ